MDEGDSATDVLSAAEAALYQLSDQRFSQGFQNISWPMPNVISGVIPGFNAMATGMMKKTFKKKGVASLEDLRQACLDSGVRLIGCQMTMDVFGFKKDDFIEGIEIGGAATFLEFAAESNITLFV